jgi:hypothetical protein
MQSQCDRIQRESPRRSIRFLLGLALMTALCAPAAATTFLLDPGDALLVNFSVDAGATSQANNEAPDTLTFRFISFTAPGGTQMDVALLDGSTALAQLNGLALDANLAFTDQAGSAWTGVPTTTADYTSILDGTIDGGLLFSPDHTSGQVALEVSDFTSFAIGYTVSTTSLDPLAASDFAFTPAGVVPEPGLALLLAAALGARTLARRRGIPSGR